MEQFDYVIVGAGAAGCVLAYRLSADPRISVALIEAGPRDSHPFLTMPKGIAKVMADPKHLWSYASVPEACTANKSETWVRGRVLGGSSSINGMVWVRGQPADFDQLAAVTSSTWNWHNISAAYVALESHELGVAATRGATGPLHITLPEWRDDLTEAQIRAGEALGLPRKEDVNLPDNGEGIGYAPRTIFRGRRQSAATAFLRPAQSRPNLTVLTHCTVDRVIFAGKRASGVEMLREGKRQTIHARCEVIVCGGAMASPGILERSGIGDGKRLTSLGINVVHDNPAVGENLAEHRGLLVQWRLKIDRSLNRHFFGWRLWRSVLRYYLLRNGPMATGAYEIGGWFRTKPTVDRPDAQVLVASYSYDFTKNKPDVERLPGMHAVVFPIRPTSRGSIHIESRDPNVAARFSPNHRATESDRQAMIAGLRMVRRYAAQQPLASYLSQETLPGPDCITDDQIMDAYDRFGSCGYHAVGTCRMGNDPASVVDPQLRVRGVEGLRVMDTSVMPVIPAGNTQAPTMAMAWIAADLILRDRTVDLSKF